jgi:hypothetical protein
MFESTLSKASAWRTIVQAEGDACIPDGVPVGLDTWGTPDDWSIPVYQHRDGVTPKSLLYNQRAWSKVASGEWKRWFNSDDVEREILDGSSPEFPYNGNVFSSVSKTGWVLPQSRRLVPLVPGKVYVRRSMLPALGPDGHMAIQQPGGSVLETYGTIKMSSADIVALSYCFSWPNCFGWPNNNGDGFDSGQTASMLPCYLGLVDDVEVTRGSINHAMAITVPASLLKPAIVYPAYAFDRNAMTEDPPYSGSLPMGGRLAIPASTDLTALGMKSPEGRTIATAAKRYGFIIVDRGGAGITIRVRRNSPHPIMRFRRWDEALDSDLQAIFRRVVRVVVRV